MRGGVGVAGLVGVLSHVALALAVDGAAVAEDTMRNVRYNS